MKRTLIALILASAMSQAPAAPSTYTIDPNHTYEYFSVSHLGFSIQHGRFVKTAGTVTLDPVAKTGSVDVTIDATSLDMGFPLWNEHLSGPDWFSTAANPTITFKSSKFVFNGDTLVAVDGDLTLRGVTKPVTLNVDLFKCAPHPMMKKDACGANATAIIKRADFGMGKYAGMIGDEAKLEISIEAMKN